MNRNIMAALEARNKAYEVYINSLKEAESVHADILYDLKDEDKIIKENIRHRMYVTELYKSYDKEYDRGR